MPIGAKMKTWTSRRIQGLDGLLLWSLRLKNVGLFALARVAHPALAHWTIGARHSEHAASIPQISPKAFHQKIEANLLL